jgi:hypothetical protein
MQANIRAMTVAGFVAIFVGGLLPGGALNRQLRRTDAEASLLKRGVEGLLLSSATDWNGSIPLVRFFKQRTFAPPFGGCRRPRPLLVRFGGLVAACTASS